MNIYWNVEMMLFFASYAIHRVWFGNKICLCSIIWFFYFMQITSVKIEGGKNRMIPRFFFWLLLSSCDSVAYKICWVLLFVRHRIWLSFYFSLLPIIINISFIPSNAIKHMCNKTAHFLCAQPQWNRHTHTHILTSDHQITDKMTENETHTF